MVRGINQVSVGRGASKGGVRLVSLFGCLFLLLLCVTGCRPLPEPLRVGANIWTGYEPLYIAQRDRLIPEEECQVIRLASAEQVISAFRNRAVDVAAVTADEAVQIASRLPEARIFLVCDYSNGADALLARPGLGSLAELKGKRVGLEANAVGAYMLAQALETAGLLPSDITAVPVPIASQEEAYGAGRVDAVVTFDPVRSRLLGHGAQSLFDSSQIPGEIADVLIARPEVLQKRRPELVRLVRAWFAARERLVAAEPETLSAAANHLGLTVKDLGESLKLIELPDPAANRRLLSDSAEGLPATIRRVAGELQLHKLVEWPVDPERMIDVTVVEGAARP